MAKITPIRATEQFQHFLEDLKESFWGDLYGQTRQAWKRFWDQQSMRERDSYMQSGWHDRVERAARRDYRNGFYERDYVTRLGTIRLRIARARGRNFIPTGLEKFQRRAEDVALLIREAFLRGISTRQVGRIVATFTGEPVSAQTVSKLTRELDAAVRKECRCWWPTESAGTGADSCWPSSAAWARARQPGKACCKISMAGVWRASGWRSL